MQREGRIPPNPMPHKIAVWLLRAIEVLFFTGLAGCVLVVMISWVSIAKASFTKDTQSDK